MPPLTENKLRVMVDANVLVAGSGWPRFPFEVVTHAAHSDYQLVLSPEIIEDARTYLGKLQIPDAMTRFEQVLKDSQ
jgi:predicted nucleic acid-binding protein